ncbi:MAG: hypothetical protein ACLQUT_12235 [Thermoleophilia bacterium]
MAKGSLSPWVRLAAVAIYALAMAVVEAMVVYYLRALFALQHGSGFPKQFNFPRALLGHEQAREVATIVMLIAVGYLAGRDWWLRFAYFLFAFGVWDIGYYAALKIMLDWPTSLATRDLLFLTPSPWWGPVWEPVLASIAFIVFGVLVVKTRQR